MWKIFKSDSFQEYEFISPPFDSLTAFDLISKARFISFLLSIIGRLNSLFQIEIIR